MTIQNRLSIKLLSIKNKLKQNRTVTHSNNLPMDVLDQTSVSALAICYFAKIDEEKIEDIFAIQ